MKLISALSAAVALSAFALSLSFDHYAIAFYAIAFSAALLLITVGDYAPRTRRWEPRLAPTNGPAPSRSVHSLRLAA